MKITKVRYSEGFLTVWTDVDVKIGFNFDMKEIVDKDDLINKVKLRVKDYLAKQQEEEDYETKFQDLIGLEGTELGVG